MKSEREWREEVLRRLEKLAGRKVNDAVKLAFLDEEDLEEIDRMDLGGLTEFKRHANGGVEIRLVDRVEALEKLYQFACQGEDGFETFLNDIRKAEAERAEAE